MGPGVQIPQPRPNFFSKKKGGRVRAYHASGFKKNYSHIFKISIDFTEKMCYHCFRVDAGVAQLAEQLICNQQVAGSSPITSSSYREGYPSGQRGQTVNLLSTTSMVRIHLPPPKKLQLYCGFLFFKVFILHIIFFVIWGFCNEC